MVKEDLLPQKIDGNIRSYVVDYIREKIFASKDINPGDRISERELARTLGTSRAPIREALKELQEQGLITSVPYKGWFITEYRKEDFWEITKLRTILEYTILEIVVQSGGPSKEEINKLRQINQELEDIIYKYKSNDMKLFKFCEKEMEFHIYIANLAKDRFIWTQKIHRNLSYQIRCSFELVLGKEKDLINSVESHNRVIQYLIDKDLNALNKEMNQKLKSEIVDSNI